MSAADLVVRDARARAGRIRDGIHNYLTTLGEIAKAWAEGDWRTLGYTDWSAYVDGEFGAERLRLPAEHRRKAIEELRLAGMSTRAIGSAVGVDHSTVVRDLAASGADAPVERVMSLDGRERPATRPPDPVPPVIAEQIEQRIAERAAPEPDYSKLDAELDAEMNDTETRFRANFSAAMRRAGEIWSFDADRIAEVYAATFDMDIERTFVREMNAFCDRVLEAHRTRQRAGLRVIEGGVA